MRSLFIFFVVDCGDRFERSRWRETRDILWWWESGVMTLIVTTAKHIQKISIQPFKTTSSCIRQTIPPTVSPLHLFLQSAGRSLLVRR